MFKTPILFLIFNRLDTAQKGFEKIKEQKPKYLYIAADWPRKTKKWEIEACKKTREEILKQIDWDCELKTLFRDENLWCKMAVSWAITRFFENVEQWIILEDDCLPDSSFFWFCETMLGKYKDDERIMMVSWDCFLPEKLQKNDRYGFTKYPHIWWWASWKRARKLYDIKMKSFPLFKENNMIKYVSDNYFAKKVFLRHFEEVYEWKIDTWDYQRVYSIWENQWISLYPWTNLISNVWFSSDSLHTKNNFWLWNLKTFKINYENISHPNNIIIDKYNEEYDEKYVQLCFKQYIANILRKMWIYRLIAKILWYNT